MNDAFQKLDPSTMSDTMRKRARADFESRWSVKRSPLAIDRTTNQILFGGNRMTMTEWFLAELDGEAAKSRRVLEQVPTDGVPAPAWVEGAVSVWADGRRSEFRMTCADV